MERQPKHTKSFRERASIRGQKIVEGAKSFKENKGKIAKSTTHRVRVLLAGLALDFAEKTLPNNPTQIHDISAVDIPPPTTDKQQEAEPQPPKVDSATEQSRKEKIIEKRQNNLLLGRLIKNGKIPLECVNPDGTFKADKIKNLPYFQENGHLIETLDLYARQLSEKSKTRQRAKEAEKIPASSQKPHYADLRVNFIAPIPPPEHLEYVEPKKTAEKKTMKKRVVAGVVAGVLAAGGGYAMCALDKKSDAVGDWKPAIAPIPAPQQDGPIVQHPREKPKTISLRVKTGDTEWGMVKDAVARTGRKPTDRLVNQLTDIAAFASLNDAPNPNQIKPGQWVHIPSPDLIKCVDDHQKKPYSQLTKNIEDLNRLPDMSKREVVKTYGQTIRNIINACTIYTATK